MLVIEATLLITSFQLYRYNPCIFNKKVLLSSVFFKYNVRYGYDIIQVVQDTMDFKLDSCFYL